MSNPSKNVGVPRSPLKSEWSDDLHDRLSSLRLGAEREAEIVEELSQHLDDRYAELRAAGVTDADARRQAIDELSQGGGLAQRMRALSQAHLPMPIAQGQPAGRVLRGISQDVTYALRTMRRQPGFALTIVVTLALGIAVNMTVFTIVNGAALRPLPYADSEELVSLNVRNVADARSQDSELSYLEFQEWRAAAPQTLEFVVGTEERGVDIAGDDRPAARVSAAFVSWDTFSMLRQLPVVGRDFRESDDRVGAAPVVIIGWSLWQARYGGNTAVVGRTIRVDGVSSTIVGVMPENFGFPYRIEFWLPLVALPERDRASRSARVLDGFGRLRSGVTIELATAELSGIATSLAERHPDTNRNIVPFLAPVGIATQFVAVLIALLGAVGFVLLIACANVANLLLARAADRARDATLRLALGASRWRIVRQLLVESLLLAAIGSVCGLALSYPGIRMFTNAAIEETPSTMQFAMDRAVILYLVTLCVGSAVVCGLVPAWHASRTSLAMTLNDAGRASVGGRQRRLWTGAFVVAQVTLALVLLSGAMLMVKNLIGLMQTDVGIETNGLSQMGMNLGARHDTADRRLLFLSQLEERLAPRPGLDAVFSSHAPLGGAFVRRVRVEGQTVADPASLPQVSVLGVGQRYFDVVGVPLIAGRSFAQNEARQGGDNVVVNERFAKMHFQGGVAVGQRVIVVEPNAPASQSTPRWMTIVGVVGNVRQRMLPSGEFDPVVYRPYANDPPQAIQVLARSASGPAAAASFVGDQVRALEPDLPVLPVMTTDQFLSRLLWAQRLFGSMFGVFAATAMLLATCGLYAVTAYAVSRRTREIGLRIALGADPRSVWLAVAGTTLRQLAIGLVLGTGGAVAVSTVLPAILVGSDGTSFLTIAAVAVLLVTAGIVASAVPARRAMQLDPTTALQAE